MNIKSLQPGDPPELALAFAQLGLKEIPGPEHNRLILEMFAASGSDVKDDETSWCAAFVNWLMAKTGGEGTGKLTARSFLDWGEAVETPRRGDVVVIKRGTESWQGHVFLYLGEAGGWIWGIGGNQSNSVSVARFSKKKLLGYRRRVAATAPSPMPAEARPAPVPSAQEVRYVQTLLRALGYAEVGEVDGKMGSMTRGAILAFRADNGLPLEPVIDDALLAALPRAKPRELAAERKEATPKEVREQAPEAKAAWWAKIVAAVLSLLSMLGTAVAFVAENLEEARELIQPVTDALGDVPGWAYLALVAGGLGWLWWKSRNAEQAAIAAVRTGARR